MDPAYGDRYAQLYAEHWWWRAREAILLRQIRGLDLPPEAEILDVGCGDGLFFPGLARFGRVRGIEVDETLLRPDGPHRSQIATQPLGNPLYREPGWSFDLITALDVIEHIDDDRRAVADMAAMLRPGGVLLVTVPAFPSLWDHHDEINQHVRRYRARDLARVLTGHGLELLQVRYLFRSLFLPKYLVARWNRGRSRKLAQSLIPPRPLNTLARWACLAEERLLHRWPLPLGTSVLGIARRPERRANLRHDRADRGITAPTRRPTRVRLRARRGGI